MKTGKNIHFDSEYYDLVSEMYSETSDESATPTETSNQNCILEMMLAAHERGMEDWYYLTEK